MDPDSYQKAWHSQSSQTRVTVAADLLLKEVQRSQRNFRATIFYRDFREVAIGLLVLPLWFFLGYWLYLPGTWYLMARIDQTIRCTPLDASWKPLLVLVGFIVGHGGILVLMLESLRRRRAASHLGHASAIPVESPA